MTCSGNELIISLVCHSSHANNTGVDNAVKIKEIEDVAKTVLCQWATLFAFANAFVNFIRLSGEDFRCPLFKNVVAGLKSKALLCCQSVVEFR